MIYSSAEYAEALYLSVREKGDGEARKALRNFVAAMKGRGLIALLPEVMKAMSGAIKRVEGTEDVLIETAHEMDDSLRADAVRAIGRKAEEVNVSVRVNPDMLGGIRVRGRDTLYDATVKDKLNRLKDAFRSSQKI